MQGMHQSIAWVNAIAGYGVHPERYALLAFMSGISASLPSDFLVRSIGKMNINAMTLSKLPVPGACLANGIGLRGVLLNCLTLPYAALWESW